MTKDYLKTFKVIRYRSLKDVTINFQQDLTTVICGENNIGKTNLLRALDLFFNFEDETKFTPNEDIPYHKFYGSRGASANVELEGIIVTAEEKEHKIKIKYEIDGSITTQLNKEKNKNKEIEEIFSKFRYFFVESNNVNIPQLLSSTLENEGLLPLDTKRGKQSKSLKALDEFINLSKKAIDDIEKEINQNFAKFTDYDGFLKDKKIKINFAEYERLRDALKNIVSITLSDGNSCGIVSKGSGAQRIVLLSLMQYIANKSKKNIIWGIDEPEVFLQPKLQKKVKKIFDELSKNEGQQIILTSHSQYFIDLKNLEQTYLFQGKLEPKEFVRKPGEYFYEMTASPIHSDSNTLKITTIKEHLGINNNDGWSLLPYNVLVEGETDKRYFETILQALELNIPHILVSNGASKISGYVQYLNIFADELTFKPKLLCVFDNDPEGQDQCNNLNTSKYKNLNIEKKVLPDLYNDHGKDVIIEDFIPQKYIFEAINTIVKKAGYNKIKLSQINNKNKPAYKNENILSFCENAIKQNNPTKDGLNLTDDGRKRQICDICCKLIDNKFTADDITETHLTFLKEVAY